MHNAIGLATWSSPVHPEAASIQLAPGPGSLLANHNEGQAGVRHSKRQRVVGKNVETYPICPQSLQVRRFAAAANPSWRSATTLLCLLCGHSVPRGEANQSMGYLGQIQRAHRS